jgi:hypothetical protein
MIKSLRLNSCFSHYQKAIICAEFINQIKSRLRCSNVKGGNYEEVNYGYSHLRRIFGRFSNPGIAVSLSTNSAPAINFARASVLPGIPTLSLSLAPTSTQMLPGELSDAELSQVQGEGAIHIAGLAVMGFTIIAALCYAFC